MSSSRFGDSDASFSKGAALVVCPRKLATKAQHFIVTCRFCGYSGNLESAGKSVKLVHTAWQPRCARCSEPLLEIARQITLSKSRQAPVRCAACAHVATYSVRSASHAVFADQYPVSGLPYFLAVSIGRNSLWFRNIDHLDQIEAFVRASLRIRAIKAPHMTSFERLSAWIKSARNRGAILRAIQHFRPIQSPAEST